eukprot:scaffold2135_cov46-Attheya_sp.AAC.2
MRAERPYRVWVLNGEDLNVSQSNLVVANYPALWQCRRLVPINKNELLEFRVDQHVVLNNMSHMTFI